MDVSSLTLAIWPLFMANYITISICVWPCHWSILCSKLYSTIFGVLGSPKLVASCRVCLNFFISEKCEKNVNANSWSINSRTKPSFSEPRFNVLWC